MFLLVGAAKAGGALTLAKIILPNDESARRNKSVESIESSARPWIWGFLLRKQGGSVSLLDVHVCDSAYDDDAVFGFWFAGMKRMSTTTAFDDAG